MPIGGRRLGGRRGDDRSPRVDPKTAVRSRHAHGVDPGRVEPATPYSDRSLWAVELFAPLFTGPWSHHAMPHSIDCSVRTLRRSVSAEQLAASGANAQFGVEYAPTPGESLRLLLRALPIDPSEFVFIDLGSGKGRVVCLASLFLFKEVIGVEFSRTLHEQSVQNVASVTATNLPQCPKVTSLCADAPQFEFPPSDLVLFLDNPFGEPVLEKVLENLQGWYGEGGRKIYLIYYNPAHEDVVRTSGFLRSGRLSWRARTLLAVTSPHQALIYTA